MVKFQGFEMKAEAQSFANEHRGLLCYEKSETEKRGRHPNDYRDCAIYGELD